MATIQNFPMERFRHHPIKVACQNLYKVPSVFPKDLKCGPLRLSPPTKIKPPPKLNPRLRLSQPPSYTPPTDSESENDDLDNSTTGNEYSPDDPESDNDNIPKDQDHINNSFSDNSAEINVTSDNDPRDSVNNTKNPYTLIQPKYGQTDYL